MAEEEEQTRNVFEDQASDESVAQLAHNLGVVCFDTIGIGDRTVRCRVNHEASGRTRHHAMINADDGTMRVVDIEW